ncbi:MAG: chromate efflux transporter [Erysipelothrix sp.]|nr:chromate efflux transporter [Erysipelothrix sp.]
MSEFKLNQISTSTFLKDVLICSLGAFGGPEAHYGIFMQQMVVKKNYLSEEELLELIALTGVLPGPSSTQTIIAIGHKVGGPRLGLLTLLVWALPIVLFMTLLSFAFDFLVSNNLSLDIVRYIGPMAIGFILLATFRISKKVIKDNLTVFLFLFSALFSYLLRVAWIYPVLLLIGGLVSVLSQKQKAVANKVKLNPPWKYLILFIIIAIGSFWLALFTSNPILIIFEKFYRYGYLVIGGGQVVIPLMYSELVDGFKYLSSQEFLVGYGFVQGMPGPMFSFSAFVGGLALRDSGNILQFLGGIIAAVGIFLPGTLLIYFVIPVWEQFKKSEIIKSSLKGVLAVAGGFMFTIVVVLIIRNDLDLMSILVITGTTLLLWSNKVPAPLIVFGVILLGLII